MGHDAYATLYACKSCAENDTRGKRKHPLQVPLSSEMLNFAFMDVFGPLLRTANRTQEVIVITDQCSKQACAINTAKMTAVHVATDFFNQKIVLYGITAYHLTTAAYHPETNDHVERYNKTVLARSHHHVAEHQKD